MSRMSEDEIEKAYELYQQGADYNEISDRLKCPPPTASSLITCFKCATKEDVIDLWVHSNYQTGSYTIEQLINVIEEMFKRRMGLWQGVMLYRLEYNKLNTLLTMRKGQEHKLTKEEVYAKCKWAEKELRIKKTKAKLAEESESGETTAKAKQPAKKRKTRRSYRKRLLTKAKSTVDIQHLIDLSAFMDNEEMEAKREAEDFQKQHPEVQIYILQQLYANKKQELAKLKEEAAPTIQKLTTMDRYRVYLMLKDAFPELSQAVLLQACILNPSHADELQQKAENLENQGDPYKDVYPYIIAICKAHDGKAGRITVAKELRKVGIYLCDQTVRKIMKRIYLSPEALASYQPQEAEDAAETDADPAPDSDAKQ